jgi:Metal-sensitive transcriptional repressor
LPVWVVLTGQPCLDIASQVAAVRKALDSTYVRMTVCFMQQELQTRRGVSEAQVRGCQFSSLLLSLRKFKQAPDPISAKVNAEVGRNAENRRRVLAINAKLTLGVLASRLEHLDRVLGSFETLCTVTQSVAQGIPVRLSVFDSTGGRVQ